MVRVGFSRYVWLLHRSGYVVSVWNPNANVCRASNSGDVNVT